MLSKLQSAKVIKDNKTGQKSKLEDINWLTDPTPESLLEQLKPAILQTSEDI